MNSSYNDNLNWRYATSKFDKTKPVDQETMKTLIEAARLSPSSFGLQPWKFLVISNEDIRKELSVAAYNQPQITESSYLVVLCARKMLDVAYVDKHIQNAAKTQGMPPEGLDGFRTMLLQSIGGQTEEQMTNWNKRQTYIALGFLLSACAQNNVDSCPMEGFSATEFDRILKLSDQNLTAAVICAVGYRDATDPKLKMKKVRFDSQEVVEWIS